MTSEYFININPFEYLEIDNEPWTRFNYEYKLKKGRCPERILSCYILDNPENSLDQEIFSN